MECLTARSNAGEFRGAGEQLLHGLQPDVGRDQRRRAYFEGPSNGANVIL